MKQRGFLSADLIRYLVFFVLLLVLIVPPLARYASRQVSVWHIEQHIAHLFELSREHYAKSVLLTRCLPQTDLDMTAIGEASVRDGVSYEVGYQQSGVPHAPPSGLRVSVTLTDPMLEPLKGWFHADGIHGNTLTFLSPLPFTLPDWQELNLATGCIK
ncbi:transporter (plasmid) [Vibrio alfacsensis]|uniref:transporter n=1 Tax=Vibrio alfacsensis TaxID=1074311 RepID=UPI002ADD33A3|nr:transporter [Vibrio alfacsensis]WQE79437.1 transporter [Vibrio alfacsensis]